MIIGEARILTNLLYLSLCVPLSSKIVLSMVVLHLLSVHFGQEDATDNPQGSTHWYSSSLICKARVLEREHCSTDNHIWLKDI